MSRISSFIVECEVEYFLFDSIAFKDIVNDKSDKDFSKELPFDLETCNQKANNKLIENVLSKIGMSFEDYVKNGRVWYERYN